jgi:ABC-2 type transport system permease protein
MKTILRIAITELKTLFYSPVAWLILIIFLCQAALGLEAKIDYFIQYKLKGEFGLPGLTEQVLILPYYDCMRNLYYYIPLITMGLISREISSGSVKLLLSSPVSIFRIIVGKYLAVIFYCFLLTVCLLLLACAGSLTVESPDFPFMLSGILGLFLMMCAYSAIGLFMSSLTAYQLIAAISTFAVLSAMLYIGHIWQDVDYIRHVTFFFSIADRTEHFIKGMISSKDIFYFLLIIALFTGLSMLVLQSKRENKPWYVLAFRYASLFTAVLILGFLTSRPTHIVYLDATAMQRNTVLPETRKILEQFDEPLKVHTYINVLDDDFHWATPENRNNDVLFFEKYQQFLKYPIEIDYTYFYDSTKWYTENNSKGKLSMKQKVQELCESFGLDMDQLLTPAEIRKRIDLRSRGNLFTRHIQYKNYSVYIGYMKPSPDPEPDPREPAMANALKGLQVKLPVLGMLTGHNERSAFVDGLNDYSQRFTRPARAASIMNNGFIISEVTLDSTLNGLAAMVIADPAVAFTPEELSKIRNYISQGGNLLITGEPGREDIVRPVIKPLGVDFMPGKLLMESKEYAADYVMSRFSKQASTQSKLIKQLYDDTSNVSVVGAVGLQYTDTGTYSIKPFIVTNKNNTWNREGMINTDSSQIAFNPSAGDIKAEIPVALTLTRNIGAREQRIMVTGDADFLANSQFDFIPKCNWALAEEICRWFSYGQFPVDTYRPMGKDNYLLITTKEMVAFRVLFFGLIPGIIFVSGISVLVTRRRR